MLHRRWIAAACRWIIAAGIGIIILIALATVGVRAYVAYALNQSNIEHITERVLHLPTQVDAVWSHWYGFQPRIHLRGVTLLNTKTRQPVIHLHQVVIQVNLLQSAMHRQLIPAAVLVRGVRLRLQSTQSQHLRFVGQQAKVSAFDVSHLIQWLLRQKNISVSDVNLVDARNLPLTHFRLQFEQSNSTYHLFIKGNLGGADQSTLTLQGNMRMTSDHWQQMSGVLYASVHHLSAVDFQRLKMMLPVLQKMKVQKLSGSTDVWLHIQRGQWQQVVSRYAVRHAEIGAMQLKDCVGQVKIEHHSGKVVVNWLQQQGQLDQADLFRQPVNLGVMSARFTARLDHPLSWLKIHQLNWQTPNIHLLMHGRADQLTTHPVLHVQGAFQVNQLSKLKSLLPLNKVKPVFAKFLDQAFESGRAPLGQFIYRGPLGLNALSTHAAQFNLLSEAHGLTLKYSSLWPSLFAPVVHVSVYNRKLVVDVPHAIDTQNALSDMRIVVPDYIHPIMQLSFNGQSRLQHVMQFLWQSPLFLPLQLKPLNLSGQIELHVDASVPLDLEGVLKSDIHGNIQLNQIGLSNTDWYLKLTHIFGSIQFDNNMLNANNLTADFNGLPLKISLHSIASAPLPITRLHVNGMFDMETLRHHLNLPLLQYWHGKSPFALRLDLHAPDDPDGDTFYFSSPLVGLYNHHVPLLLAKLSTDKKPLNVVINVHHDKSIFVRGDYNRQVNATLVFHHASKGFQFYSGNVDVGGDKSAFALKAGLSLSGHLKQLDTEAWLALYHQMKKDGVGSTQAVNLQHVNFSVDQLKWQHHILHEFHVKIASLQEKMRIQLVSKEVVGMIELPYQKTLPWKIRMAQLNLPQMKQSSAHFKFMPDQIPSMDLQIQHLSIGGHHDGSLSFVTSHRKNELLLNHLHWKTANAALSVHGAWQHTQSGDQTRLQGHLSSSHWGQCLKRWQSSPMLLGGQGQLEFSAWWPDKPTHIDWPHLLGRIAFNIDNGVVGHLSQGAMTAVGLGRMLNVLSVGAMVSHMRSDFKDMPNNGLWFNHLNGHWAIRQGVAATQDLSLVGQVVRMQGQGSVDLAHHQLDMNLALTPQMTNSLPLVAGVVGGPIAGVAAWIANKMFGQQVDQLSASMVHVSGAWAHPHVKKLHRNGNQWV